MALKGVPQRTFAIPFLDTPACLILRTGRDSLCDTQVLIKPDGVQDAGIRGETGHGMNGADYSRWVRQKKSLESYSCRCKPGFNRKAEPGNRYRNVLCLDMEEGDNLNTRACRKGVAKESRRPERPVLNRPEAQKPH